MAKNLRLKSGITDVDITDADITFMQRALYLAKKGIYTTAPNPNVGCVLVKNGEVIGEGYHRKAGGPHAEIHALRSCEVEKKGATAYVTLEPCSHFGRTPPCSSALIEAGITRVIIAMQDPNPLVSGGGIQLLQDADIEVFVGICEEEAKRLNHDFIYRMLNNHPYTQLKMGMSIDGRTAMASGESKWITNLRARSQVQTYRAQASAILSSSSTVLADDPLLTVRWAELPDDIRANYDESTVRQPVRIIIDSQHRVTPQHRLFSVETPVWLVSYDDNPHDLSDFPDFVEVITLLRTERPLHELMKKLAERQINSLWLEAGAHLVGSLLSEKLVNELIVYMAPLLIGDNGRGLCHLPSITRLKDALSWKLILMEPIGNDIKLVYEPI